MIKSIVIGSLNTDIVASGVKRFPSKGQHVYAEKITIGPGGKSRNVAEMIAKLSEDKTVAMVGLSVKDKFNLWKPPIEALEAAGADTRFVTIYENEDELPGIAMICVDTRGNNQIYAAAGVSGEFSKKHIDQAKPLFEEASKSQSFLVLTLELPVEVAEYASKLAQDKGITIVLDPGGVQSADDLKDLAKQKLFLLKPNEHEAETLTGQRVTDLKSAERAAKKLFEVIPDLSNLLITHGEHGAYLFENRNNMGIHISIPSDISDGDTKDATGAGDQTFAGVVAKLQSGASLREACEFGIRVGTMQFHRAGIKPVKNEELKK